MSAPRTRKTPKNKTTREPLDARVAAVSGQLVHAPNPRELFSDFINTGRALDELAEQLREEDGQADLTSKALALAFEEIHEALPTPALQSKLSSFDDSHNGDSSYRSEASFLVGFAAGVRLAGGAR